MYRVQSTTTTFFQECNFTSQNNAIFVTLEKGKQFLVHLIVMKSHVYTKK